MCKHKLDKSSAECRKGLGLGLAGEYSPVSGTLAPSYKVSGRVPDRPLFGIGEEQRTDQNYSFFEQFVVGTQAVAGECASQYRVSR